MVLEEQSKTFVMHAATLETLLSGMTIHFSWVAQIFDNNPMQIAALKQNKAPTKILFKYLDFTHVFLEKETLVLPKQIELNKYAIKLEDDKQPLYKPI